MNEDARLVINAWFMMNAGWVMKTWLVMTAGWVMNEDGWLVINVGWVMNGVLRLMDVMNDVRAVR